MDPIGNYKISIIFLIIFNSYLIPFTFCSFHNMKKISDIGDYFIILDNGLYIYNFEKSKCEKIRDLDKSIFNSNNEYNNILISKNSNSNNIKIAALINQYLYVCSYNKLSCDYQFITSLVDKDHYIYPFDVIIDNYKLRIDLVKYKEGGFFSSSKYYIKAFEFENYSSIKYNEPNIKDHNDDYSNELICQFDSHESLIKCVYPYGIFEYLKYREINYSLNILKDIFIEEILGSTYTCITFTFSDNKVFVCALRNDEIECFYKKKSSDDFINISHGYEKGCKNLKTYFFNDKNEFILSCKKSNYYYLYIFNADNLDINFQTKSLLLPNYNGAIDIIFNRTTNNYNIISDNNFTESCEAFNKDEGEKTFLTDYINIIQEKTIKTDIYISEPTKSEETKSNKSI